MKLWKIKSHVGDISKHLSLFLESRVFRFFSKLGEKKGFGPDLCWREETPSFINITQWVISISSQSTFAPYHCKMISVHFTWVVGIDQRLRDNCCHHAQEKLLLRRQKPRSDTKFQWTIHPETGRLWVWFSVGSLLGTRTQIVLTLGGLTYIWSFCSVLNSTLWTCYSALLAASCSLNLHFWTMRKSTKCFPLD